MAVDRTTLFENLGNTIDPTDETVVLSGASSTWSAGVPFERASAVPLEKYSLFPTLGDAQTYASKNPVAYPGQVVMVVAAGADGTTGTVTPYVIKQDGTLGELATTAYADQVKKEVLETVGNPFHFEKVDSLPAEGEASILYLLKNAGDETGNLYDEYLWVSTSEGGAWEKIGTTTVDLSGYLTTEAFNAKMGTIDGTVADNLASKVATTDVQSTINDSANPVSSAAVQTALAQKADASRVGDAEEALQTHKEDTTVHITAEEREAWNAKQSKITASGLLKGDGEGGVSAAVAGTDYVAPEDGKGLSSNDFTAEEKTKLSGIAEGATKTIVDAALSTTSTNPVQNSVITTELNKKVTSVDGMGLSSNDYDDAAVAEVAKISGIETTLGNKADASVLEDYVLESEVQTAVNDSASPVASSAVKAEIDSLNSTIGDINTLLDSLNGEVV